MSQYDNKTLLACHSHAGPAQPLTEIKWKETFGDVMSNFSELSAGPDDNAGVLKMTVVNKDSEGEDIGLASTLSVCNVQCSTGVHGMQEVGLFQNVIGVLLPLFPKYVHVIPK